MPTATSIGLFTRMRIIASPIAMPTMTSGQGISPPTIPCERAAISPACGAGRLALPKPPVSGLLAMSEVCSR